jgi:hypothetical protein
MSLKSYLLISGLFVLGVIWSALQRSPQLGGTFEGDPYLVTGDPATAWTIYISVGVRGTSGNFRTVVLYGEGPKLLEPILAARDSDQWVRLETDRPPDMWWATYHIQGIVRSAVALP